MKARNFCGLVVVLSFLVCGMIDLSIAGMPSGGPSAPTLEGGPTYVNGSGSAASLQGTPLPAPQTATGSLNSNPSGGGLQTGAPGTGSNHFGTTERGVAGSGLPREKVSVVNTKLLPSTKSDGKFDASLLGSDLKSVKEVKEKGSAQNETAKAQTSTDKASLTSKTPEKSSSSTDSTKIAEKH